MKNERENALDKKFHALSNPTRREILMRLSQKPHSAGEIAGYFQITPASISYHLSLLQRSGLICCRQVEKRRIYSMCFSKRKIACCAMKLLSPFLSHPGFSTGKIPPEIARIRLEWIESKSIF